MPKQCLTTVLDNSRLTERICSLRLRADDIAESALPGQFVHIRCGDDSLLRRPISICDIEDGQLTIVVEARGEGTRWLWKRRPGEKLDMLGPLGRGFDLGRKNIILVGGGIGVPPMLYAARACTGKAISILGFRNKDCIILRDEFESACAAVITATDDGSFGAQGPVTLPLKKLLDKGDYDAVLACGPKAMLKAVAESCASHHVPCQVSMEERMGCGIGACLVCACKTKKDGKEEMRHVCKDGPVFRAEEVVW